MGSNIVYIEEDAPPPPFIFCTDETALSARLPSRNVRPQIAATTEERKEKMGCQNVLSVIPSAKTSRNNVCDISPRFTDTTAELTEKRRFNTARMNETLPGSRNHELDRQHMMTWEQGNNSPLRAYAFATEEDSKKRLHGVAQLGDEAGKYSLRMLRGRLRTILRHEKAAGKKRLGTGKIKVIIRLCRRPRVGGEQTEQDASSHEDICDLAVVVQIRMFRSEPNGAHGK